MKKYIGMARSITVHSSAASVPVTYELVSVDINVLQHCYSQLADRLESPNDWHRNCRPAQ